MGVSVQAAANRENAGSETETVTVTRKRKNAKDAKAADDTSAGPSTSAVAKAVSSHGWSHLD
jgi:hypothetical protein